MSLGSAGQRNGIQINVCLGTNGIAAGAKDVLAAFKTCVEEQGLNAAVGKRACVKQTGCRGLCVNDVLVDIITPELGQYSYAKVKPEMVPQLVEDHIKNATPVAKWIVADTTPDSKLAKFMDLQERHVLKNCGTVDPENIDDYISNDGYSALRKVLTQHSPQEVIETVKTSHLRGRGGAGFPTGEKWEICANTESEKRYIVCNGQECDPGTFKDRSLLEGDPHAIIEGMIICAYAIGADEAFICINPDYKLGLERIEKAVSAAEEKGLLGENINGCGFSFKIHPIRGVKTFSCGEATALVNTIEGKRGYPRLTPPHAAVSGLWGKPTIVNNVETFANIPLIIGRGPKDYSHDGTATSRGTKVFALAGAVKNIGLIEVPMGTTLREIIFDIGGGPANKKSKFKGVQVGGPLGGCYSEKELDVTVDYETLSRYNSTVGSGGIVVLDHRTCIVDFVKHLMNFAQQETCGKCAPCRLGTEVIFELLERITKGEGEENDIDTLYELGEDLHDFTLCGLGKMAPNPLLTSIKFFRDEYEAHIVDKTCPALVCQALYKFVVNADKCVKCGICFKKSCKFDAIKWEPKQVAVIDTEKCVQCGACVKACPFMAIL